MSYGLQVYNSLGQIRLDTTDRIPRYLGSISGIASSGQPETQHSSPGFYFLFTRTFNIPVPGILANGEYFTLLTSKIVETFYIDDAYGQHYTAISSSVSQIARYHVWEITNLTGTTQAQWNTLAGTSGVVYAVGSWFFNTVLGTGLGTGTVKTWPPSITAYASIPSFSNVEQVFVPSVTPYNGGFNITWPAQTITGYYWHYLSLYYTLQAYTY